MLSSHCENMLAYAAAGRRAVLVDPRRYRPNVEVAPNCPRCDSPNTKFCYYNNYSLSQPRYFCKGCRRYWTKGGSLRNVPVGGGCRKNRRGKSVRSMVDTVVADAATPGSAFSHRLHGSVRPDLLLEGMVGNRAELGPPASADKPAVADGSTIDLALLYSKFLRHQPPVEQCAVVRGSAADTLSSGSSAADMSPPSTDAQPLVPSGPSQHGLGELCGPAITEASASTMLQQCADAGGGAHALGELSFSVDVQSCYESLGLAMDSGDLILPSTWGSQESKYEPFDSLPEDAMSLHLHDGLPGGDDVWSNALGGCQGLEAALCRP